MLLLLKVFGVIFFDWVLLCNAGFNFFPIKSIYAMREHRAAMVEESLDNSIEMVLRLLEIYILGKGEIL